MCVCACTHAWYVRVFVCTHARGGAGERVISPLVYQSQVCISISSHTKHVAHFSLLCNCIFLGY